MALVAGNVRVAVTGAVYAAPAATAVPTSTAAALNAAFVDVGYLSEDGVTTSIATDSNDIIAWQNGTLVRRVQTSHDFTLQFTMIETNGASLLLYFGNYTVGGAGSGSVQITGAAAPRGAYVLHVVDGTDLIRVVIPDGQVTDRGEVTYLNGDAVGYDTTITAYPDASGVKAYLYYETVGAS